MVSALTVLAVLVLMIITFALGTTLTKSELMAAVKKKPKSLLLAIFLQYAIMPLYLYIFWHIFDLNAFHGVGMIAVGVSPAGVGSNLFSYLTHSDVALSIVAVSIATLLALGMMPLLLYIYVDAGGISDGSLEIDYVTIVVTGILLLVPAVVGVIIRAKSAIWAKRAEKAGGIIGILFLIAAVIFGVASESHIFTDTPAGVWFCAWTLQPMGTAVGWLIAYLCGCSRKDQRVIALATGAQNTTIAIAVVTLTYDDQPDIRDEVLTYVLLETFAYLFNSIAIVLFFRYVIAPYDTKEDAKDELPMEKDPTEVGMEPVSSQGPSEVTSTSSSSGLGLLVKVNQ